MLSQAQIFANHGPPCRGSRARVRMYGRGTMEVRTYAAEAFVALSQVFRWFDYSTRAADTGAGVCRRKVGSYAWSVHALWIAGDTNWQCLSHDTLITTWDGPQRVGDLVGTTARILTRDPVNGGKAGWVEAPIVGYGEADVFDVVLSRRGITKTVTTTAEHRWFHVHGHSQARKHWRNVETITADLEVGQRILGCLPRGVDRTLVSSVGVAAGNVFGDGSRGANRDSLVCLFGPSVELLRFYPEPNVTSITTPNGVHGLRVMNLPGYFKDVPPLDESSSYLLGWLAGYFAADGHVSASGQPSICSATYEHLQLFSTIAARVGIACGPITTSKRDGYGGVSDKHNVTLLPSTVPERFFVRSDHAERFSAMSERRNPSDHLWKVESVTPAGRADVACPHVESTGVFALDGWILTGNSNPYGSRRTDRPRGLNQAVIAVRTNSGAQVFNNGIFWNSGPDPMHDEIVCRRSDLATGINWRTVPGGAPGGIVVPKPPPSVILPPPPPPRPKGFPYMLFRKAGDDAIWFTNGVDRVQARNEHEVEWYQRFLRRCGLPDNIQVEEPQDVNGIPIRER